MYVYGCNQYNMCWGVLWATAIQYTIYKPRIYMSGIWINGSQRGSRMGLFTLACLHSHFVTSSQGNITVPTLEFIYYNTPSWLHQQQRKEHNYALCNIGNISFVHVNEKSSMDEEGIRLWLEHIWSRLPGGLHKERSLLM